MSRQTPEERIAQILGKRGKAARKRDSDIASLEATITVAAAGIIGELAGIREMIGLLAGVQGGVR